MAAPCVRSRGNAVWANTAYNAFITFACPEVFQGGKCFVRFVASW